MNDDKINYASGVDICKEILTTNTFSIFFIGRSLIVLLKEITDRLAAQDPFFITGSVVVHLCTSFA